MSQVTPVDAGPSALKNTGDEDSITMLKTFASTLSQSVGNMQNSVGVAMQSLMSSMARTNQAMKQMSGVMETYLGHIVKIYTTQPTLVSTDSGCGIRFSVVIKNTGSIPLPAINCCVKVDKGAAICRDLERELVQTPTKRQRSSLAAKAAANEVFPYDLSDEKEAEGALLTKSFDLNGDQYVRLTYIVDTPKFTQYNVDVLVTFPSPTSNTIEVKHTATLYALYQCQFTESETPVLQATGEHPLQSQVLVIEARVIRSLFRISLVKGISENTYYVVNVPANVVAQYDDEKGGKQVTEGAQGTSSVIPVLQIQLTDTQDNDGVYARFEFTSRPTENRLHELLLSDILGLESCDIVQ